MPSLNYEEIYSKFRLKAEAYDILQYREDDVSAVFMPEYLHASINKPYIRRLFSELKLGDTVQELTYIMKYSVDDDFEADKTYVKGTFLVKGHIRLVHVLISGIRLLKERDIRNFIKKFFK